MCMASCNKLHCGRRKSHRVNLLPFIPFEANPKAKYSGAIIAVPALASIQYNAM